MPLVRDRVYRIDKPLMLNGGMATQAMFDTTVEGLSEPRARDDVRAASVSGSRTGIRLSLYDDLAAIEQDWRTFEEGADCTVFQTFDWLSTWQRNIGARQGVTPAIVVGRLGDEVLFMFPFGLEAGGALRRVTWLGSYLCNYNAPLLGSRFSDRVGSGHFAQIWSDVQLLLRTHLRHDLIDLEKMPARIGNQANPLMGLTVTPHVNDSYQTNLVGAWDSYYATKRSSATRKNDRKKRKRLADHGEIKFVTATDPDQVVRSVDALIDEKRKSYALLGVQNMFEWPGYRDFFIDLANGAQSGRLVHVSRFEVGSAIAAANFGLTFRGRYYYILAGYDDGELARFGPGTAQLQDLLQYSFQHGIEQFDFTIGDEPYKREWCDVETKLYDQVSPATWRGWLAAGPLIVLRLVKRWVKRNPKVWSVVRKLRARLGSLRG